MRTTRSTRLTVAAAAAALTGALLAPAPATAAPSGHTATARRNCATRAQYRRVHRGQTVRRVNRILHSRGKVQAHSSMGGYRSEIKSYPACGQYSFIDVSFSANPHKPLREDGKTALWG